MSGRAEIHDPAPPPAAERRPATLTRVTGDVTDDWAWLRDRDDPATIAYLEAENAHTESWCADHAPLIAAIDGEIRSRVLQTDLSAPMRHGGHWYSSRTVEGLDYPIHCRSDRADDPDPGVILDENVESTGHDFFDLGALEPSPDHRLLAWSADTRGDEHYTLRIRDIDGQSELDDVIPDTTWAGVAWSADGNHLLYVVADETERPYEVRAHRLGSATSSDRVIFREDDEHFYVGIGATRSGRYIVIHTSSKTTSEVHLVDATDIDAPPEVVRPRADGIEYQADDWGDRLVIVTNLDAVDFRVMTAPHHSPGEWTEFIPGVSGHRISALEPFEHRLAVLEWVEAQPRIRILDREGRETAVDLGDEPHDVTFGPNEEWGATAVRLVHQSLTSPPRILDADLVDGSTTVVRTTPTPNVDVDAYVAHRDWAVSADGTRVPFDVVRHRDTPLDGTAPALVYAYGSYEISVPPWFSVGRLSLLDRGFVWVLAHPRGGGELGRDWYLRGRLLDKRNTFDDVNAVATQIGANGTADPTRLTVRGGSAGGLMVGACITMRPDLWHCAVAEVPFVDVVTTMSDPTLPLTVTEWDEWGDPRIEPWASYIASYSPYDNTVSADRPAMLVTAGLNDPRVGFHEPAKWVARMRHLDASSGEDARALLLRTEMGAGHAGPSGRYSAWREEAETLAFVLTEGR